MLFMPEELPGLHRILILQTARFPQVTGARPGYRERGYIGGIVGYQNAAYIYNTHVSGTIGGYHSKSIGGITGRYAAGKIKVARFSGTIEIPSLVLWQEKEPLSEPGRSRHQL